MPALRASVLLILVGGLWLALAGFANQPHVGIVVESRIQFEPAQIRLRVQVEPHEANRVLMVAAVDGGDVMRRSDEQLEGARSARTRWIEWDGIGAGEYTAVAVVRRADGSEARAQAPFRVISRY